MSDPERLVLATLVAAAYALLCLYCWWRHRPTRGAETGHVLVAYASQTGTAARLARQSAEAFGEGASLMALNQVDQQVLSRVRRALFVASTAGNGEAPDNGAAFARRFLGAGDCDLSNLEFAVLALGDSRYGNFCGFGHRLHDILSRSGASPLGAPVAIDGARPEASASALTLWRQYLERWSDASVCHAVVLPSVATAHWVLAERRHLNPGSPGEPLFHLRFRPGRECAGTWQAGDIAVVTPPGDDTPRHYSIASLPNDDSLELVVRQQRGADGIPGLASGWLTGSLCPGDVVVLGIRDNPLFRAPPAETPLILVGNGSGIAGLRALLRHRECSGGGRNWLLFGERDPRRDRPFAGELDAWLRAGHLDHLDLAFSRCPSSPGYVQAVLRQRAGRLERWLAAGAIIMVCGSRQGMGEGVHSTLAEVLGVSARDALEDQGRYRRDVY